VVLFYATLLILTTLAWGYLFYKKDYHPQPFRVIAQSFGMGLFAMAPVFGYKYLYQHFLPMLSEYEIFQPLLNSAFLSGVLMFVLNLIILSLILFVLSGLVSIILTIFNHNVLVNLKNALKDEPLGFVAVSLMIGMAIYLQTLFQNWFNHPIIGTALGTILFLAIIEEYIKHLIVRITDDKRLKDIDDAITLSIVVGLAFAFTENIIYSLVAGDMGIIFYRTMISIPIHLVASGIFGYYYGLAHFAQPIVKIEEGEKTYKAKWLPKLLTLKRSTMYREEKIIEGIFFATLFHAIINLLFEFTLGFLAVPLIIVGIVIIFRLYKIGRKEGQLITKFQKGWRPRTKKPA